MDTEKNFAENAITEAAAPNSGQAASLEDQQAERKGSAPCSGQASAEEMEKLRAEAAKAKENWDKMLRVAADFENYKKKAARDRQDVTRYANESILQRLIPVLDNFESALLSTNQGQPASVESLQTGLQMIYQQLKGVLAEAGVEEVEALSKPFDPNVHEALSMQERPDVPDGQVIQQMRKGYKLRDRLLRPAAVIVSKRPEKK